jgi:serine/threonine protein kinase, bacterial
MQKLFYFRKLIILIGLLAFSVPLNASSENQSSPTNLVDGQKATSVIFTLVDGIAVDPNGNIYISHRSQNRVRKIDKNGIVSTIAGNGHAKFSGDGGLAKNASLNFPAGLAFDSTGNLYVADRNNHRVRRINPNGIISTIAGNGAPNYTADNIKATESSLHFPSDVAVDKSGQIYISDRSNNRIRKVDSKGIITTYAGMGVASYGGDFGPADEAFLKFPFGITFDNQGNLFVADRGNNRIRKIDPEGIIYTVAGTGLFAIRGDYGPAKQADLAFPTDVTSDNKGNIYIADRNNNRIRKVDPDGIITTFMGTGLTHYNGDQGVASQSNLHLPFSLTITPDQKSLLVVDRSHFRIRKVDFLSGRVKTIAGNGQSLMKGDGGPALGATLEGPSGITINDNREIIFADQMQNRLRKIDTDGNIYGFAGTGKASSSRIREPALEASLLRPNLVTKGIKNDIYAAERNGNGWRIVYINSEGLLKHFAGNALSGSDGDGGQALEASFITIRAIVVGPSGELYIADRSNRFVRKIDRNGIISKVAEKAWDELPGDIHPRGLTVDSDGNLYVSDSGVGKIYKINSNNNVEIVAGNGDFEDHGDNGPALLAGIRSPGALALSPDNELYICEQQTHRIRKIDKTGRIVSVAGTGEGGFSGDGGPATKAQFQNPRDIAFDSLGNLFVTDRGNNRIRKIDYQGIVTTVAGTSNFGYLQDGLEVNLIVHNFP